MGRKKIKRDGWKNEEEGERGEEERGRGGEEEEENWRGGGYPSMRE